MRAVVQRVSEAFVEVATLGETGRIGKGLLVLLGVGQNDTEADVALLAEKVANLRIFPDEDDKMNRSVLDAGGGILVVSQFTLHGDCRKGRRPSFVAAAPPEKARDLYERFVEAMRRHTPNVATGLFQEMMRVHLINDGPVTLLLDTEKTF